MKSHPFLALAACLLVLLLPTAAGAGIRPSSTVLVPYFEVDLSEHCRTTYFAVSNHSSVPQEVEVEVRTNWGIPVFTTRHTIPANGVMTANLADWLVRGRVFDTQLSAEQIAHLQAVLSGKPSPSDGLYYATEIYPDDWAVGSVRIRTLETPAPDVLWGDYYIYCTKQPFVEGETLVNLDKGVDEHLPCPSHGIRFLESDALETELMFWSALRGQPSKDDVLPDFYRLAVAMEIYDEAGDLLEIRQLRLLPNQLLALEDLDLPARFGWMQLTSSDDFFVTAHINQLVSPPVSLGLHSYCLPEEAGHGGAIDLIKRVNGQRAGMPPGVEVTIGGGLSWEYTVTNTGAVTLHGVAVDDDALGVTCPKDTLEPDESMVCTASSTAVACQHRNDAVASGTTPDGMVVQDQDIGYYYGDPAASIDIEKLVEGQDADSPPGPKVRAGTPVAFLYGVTNTGDTALTGVVVTDDQGYAVSCPKSALAPGESMTCTAHTTAVAGSHRDVGTVTAVDLCAQTVSDQDPAHYLGWKPEQGIAIQKLTNGEDANTPPGPTIPVGAAVSWAYLVTNTGEVGLLGVTVTDDRGVAVICPKSALSPGESMTCIGAGVAVACQYTNLGTATASTGEGETVSAQDPSHYFGQHHAAIALEKRTNGQDADQPPGPGIPVGAPVQWTFLVTNTGDVALTDVAVFDDHDTLVTCPKSSLQPGESMTCTANGKAVAGQYSNVGAVSGKPPCGDLVTAQDLSHYYGQSPDIALEKLVNGEEADTPPGPSIVVGASVLWTYVVTDTGDVALSNVTVTDDQGVAVSCPMTVLAPAESMTCTASGTAVTGQYANVGTVTGTPPSGPAVTATDPSHYFGINPAVTLEKRVNGQDADTPPGPTILAGNPVAWTYHVTNTGDVTLSNVMVTDDQGVAVSCPKTTLAAGESMTCTASGTAVAGQYANVGTVTGTPPAGLPVTASDPAHYFGGVADISLEKLVNGEDADTAPGPSVLIGSVVVFTYVVTNVGTVLLDPVTVTDNRGYAITCPKTKLAPAETMTCTASTTAVVGEQLACVVGCLHHNIGTATGKPPGGSPVSDSDSGYYTCFAGYQGCTPGYWKNHTASWPPTGYTTGQDIDTVFASVNTYYSDLGNAGLREALSFTGGSGNHGAAEILLRAAVAALLNAAHPNVAYPRTAASVIADVNTALLDDRDTMLALAALLDADNNRGCPLN
jgi:hypothetical protein